MQFIDWIEFINKNKKSYHKKYRTPLEKIIGITWAVLTHKNYFVLKNWKVKPAQIINLVGCTFHDIKYFSDLSDMFQQDANNKDHYRPNGTNPHNGR